MTQLSSRALLNRIQQQNEKRVGEEQEASSVSLDENGMCTEFKCWCKACVFCIRFFPIPSPPQTERFVRCKYLRPVYIHSSFQFNSLEWNGMEWSSVI